MESNEIFEKRVAACNAAYKAATGRDNVIDELKAGNLSVLSGIGYRINPKGEIILTNPPACFHFGLAIPRPDYDWKDLPEDPKCRVSKTVRAPSLSLLIRGAFIWEASVQGHDYWDKLCREVERNGK